MGNIWEDTHYRAGGHEKIAVTNASTPSVLTAAAYQPTSGSFSGRSATKVLITVETDEVRWRCDSGAPGADAGHKAASGDAIILTEFNNIKNFQAVKVTTNAVLRVTYYFSSAGQ